MSLSMAPEITTIRYLGMDASFDAATWLWTCEEPLVADLLNALTPRLEAFNVADGMRAGGISGSVARFIQGARPGKVRVLQLAECPAVDPKDIV